jgi:hypothetical protein
MAKGKRTLPKKSRVPRSLADQQIVLHRRVIETVTKAAADAGYAYSLTLSDLNASDILSLFSEYKITSVTATHQLVNAPNNNATFPRLHIAPRGFSVTNPVNRNEVLQYNGLQQFQFGPAAISYKHKYVPYVWIDAVSTAGTGKEVVRSPWIATDSDTVRHNYAVTWMDRYNTTTDPTHTIELLLDVVLIARKPR